jgi:endonuclease YncB( thermonuclease family)
MKRTVKRVIDGDTFETYRKVNGSHFVRIAGYNAQERYQYGGQQATNTLKSMISGRTVTVNPVARSYGRTVAQVKTGHTDISKELKKRR